MSKGKVNIATIFFAKNVQRSKLWFKIKSINFPSFHMRFTLKAAVYNHQDGFLAYIAKPFCRTQSIHVIHWLSEKDLNGLFCKVKYLP